MEKNALINETVKLCVDYKILMNPITEYQIKEIIEKQINDIAHVETLIKKIIEKTSNCKDADIERVKAVRKELENLRIDLEFANENGQR